MREPLAKLWNIENEEIPLYLSIEKKLPMMNDILKPLLDDDYFGGAPNSTAKLTSRFQDRNNLAKSFTPKYCMGYINSEINNIIIASCNETRNETSNTAFINAINDRMYFPIFTYYNCFNTTNHYASSLNNMNFEKRNNKDKQILAGDGLYSYKEKTKPGKVLFIFIHGIQQHSQLKLGEMSIHSLEPMDFGLININIKDIQPVPSVMNTDSERYKELPIDDIISVSSNGAHLCLSGVLSHVKCGYVAALNGFTSNGVYFRDNIFVVNLRSFLGDSGGPIFHYKSLTQVSLNGIVQGGLFDFNDNINGITGVITIGSILNVFKDLEVVTNS
ncbi:hypothetical protein C2G38_2192307 [Gigaspora rosea]|uniref:Trypsin-like cysteine/serine peptidase domain-containing protein n=1 Tax=Gigaspora rosea TaxID=44941 RepID=A0A397V1I8_9GLOM|nr:hypothetical protein C2G38_2192307 [Gigaspora rosea]